MALTAGQKRRGQLISADLDLFTSLGKFVFTTISGKNARLQFVAHSDAAILLDRFLLNLTKNEFFKGKITFDTFVKSIESITYVAPLCTFDQLKFTRKIAAVWRKQHLGRKINLITLSSEDEARDTIGVYPGSYPNLVQNVLIKKTSTQSDKDDGLLALSDNVKAINKSPYLNHWIYPEKSPVEFKTHFNLLKNPTLWQKICDAGIDHL